MGSRPSGPGTALRFAVRRRRGAPDRNASSSVVVRYAPLVGRPPAESCGSGREAGSETREHVRGADRYGRAVVIPPATRDQTVPRA
jgi:hypothetical protein